MLRLLRLSISKGGLKGRSPPSIFAEECAPDRRCRAARSSPRRRPSRPGSRPPPGPRPRHRAPPPSHLPSVPARAASICFVITRRRAAARESAPGGVACMRDAPRAAARERAERAPIHRCGRFARRGPTASAVDAPVDGGVDRSPVSASHAVRWRPMRRGRLTVPPGAGHEAQAELGELEPGVARRPRPGRRRRAARCRRRCRRRAARPGRDGRSRASCAAGLPGGAHAWAVAGRRSCRTRRGLRRCRTTAPRPRSTTARCRSSAERRARAPRRARRAAGRRERVVAGSGRFST